MFMIKILLNICYIIAILEQKFEQEYQILYKFFYVMCQSCKEKNHIKFILIIMHFQKYCIKKHKVTCVSVSKMNKIMVNIKEEKVLTSEYAGWYGHRRYTITKTMDTLNYREILIILHHRMLDYYTWKWCHYLFLQKRSLKVMVIK